MELGYGQQNSLTTTHERLNKNTYLCYVITKLKNNIMPNEDKKGAINSGALNSGKKYAGMPFRNNAAAKADRGGMDSKDQMSKLQTYRKELLQTPSGAEGKAARDARMNKIKSVDKAIIKRGGKITPLK
jgi:hypothetical protein